MTDRRVAGIDACLRAPKSVSLLYAFGDPVAAGAVVDAHEHATREALRYLEDVGSHSRRGKAGAGEPVAGRGFIGAAFRHRDARPVHDADCGDPLIHTHCVLANMVEAVDGQWGALDGRVLFRHAKTAGYVYQSALREELTARLGVAWEPVKNGHADVAGIPRTAVEHFSRRRGEITAEMARRGEEGAAAAQTATLSTRAGKADGVDEPTLRERWQDRADEIGYGPDQVTDLLAARRGSPDHPSLSVNRLSTDVDDVFGAEGLTRHASTFAHRDVLRAVADNSPGGAGLDALREHTTRLLASPEVVAVGTGPDQRWTTREMLAIEATSWPSATRADPPGWQPSQRTPSTRPYPSSRSHSATTRRR